jgi:hypothetical protein
MAAEIITKEDLTLFKTELIQELRELLTTTPTAQPQKKWIKSNEVREMLGISPGTLQNMRINGTIAFKKLGGLIFYDYNDIIKLMEPAKKTSNKQPRMF